MSFVSGRQILGARDRQEDAFRIVQQDTEDPGADLLLLLADGMGGHAGGDVASALVLEIFERHFIRDSRNPRPVPRLVEAMEVANAALRERVAQDPALAGMGCTLIAAVKLGSRLHWLSIGDSLLYLYRDGTLRRLNADHSVHGELLELVQKGQMTRQEADHHPKRNALRSAMTGERVALVDTNAMAIQPQDLFVLASDGLETIDEAALAALLGQAGREDPRALSADLLNSVEAAAAPRQDNTTVLVYRYDPAGRRTGSTDSLFVMDPPARRWPLWAWGAGLAGFVVAGGVLGAFLRPAPADRPSPPEPSAAINAPAAPAAITVPDRPAAITVPEGAEAIGAPESPEAIDPVPEVAEPQEAGPPPAAPPPDGQGAEPVAPPRPQPKPTARPQTSDAVPAASPAAGQGAEPVGSPRPQPKPVVRPQTANVAPTPSQDGG